MDRQSQKPVASLRKKAEWGRNDSQEGESHELDELDTQIKDVSLSFTWECHFLWVRTLLRNCGMQQRKYDITVYCDQPFQPQQ